MAKEVFEIPLVKSTARFKIRTVLDGIELVLKIDWNDRAQRFQLSIFDANESPLVEGLCLNVDTEILRKYTIDGLPTGKLFLYDTSGTHSECGLDDLGERCKLTYQSGL